MTQDEALLIAQAYAAKLVKVEVTAADPEDVILYDFDSNEDYLFRIDDPSVCRVGSSRYIAVSKTSGIARNAGSSGE